MHPLNAIKVPETSAIAEIFFNSRLNSMSSK
jgi:hypothetical protein